MFIHSCSCLAYLEMILWQASVFIGALHLICHPRPGLSSSEIRCYFRCESKLSLHECFKKGNMPITYKQCFYFQSKLNFYLVITCLVRRNGEQSYTCVWTPIAKMIPIYLVIVIIFIIIITFILFVMALEMCKAVKPIKSQ